MKLLHLDDHYIFTQGFNAVFQKQQPSVNITSVMDAKSALSIIDETNDLDLILVDLNLPELDGLAFINAIEQRQLLIPVVALSASEDMWQIKQAIDSGASGFIPKSYSFEEISNAINTVLEGEIYIPKDIQQNISKLPSTQPNDNQFKVLSAYQLGQRQLDVLQLMQQGYSNDDIAKVLNLSKNTIRSHARTLFIAFNVGNRIECVRFAERVGILSK